jgi:hypothetical protein
MSHKFVVIDEIMEQLEAAKSGIVPGSVTQAVVSGIQNVPSQIVQRAPGQGSSTAYTTFPLSPIVRNCCIDKSYINLEFDINFSVITHENNTDKIIIPFYLGFRDNASIFNQLQIMIENTALWTTTYQREESTLSYNSLPETEIRGNNQYASIEKIREGKYSPMKRLLVTVQNNGDNDVITPVTLRFKGTVDLNRLTPLLSNLHFTTPHMGNLRLKLFIQEIEKALLFCPDYNICTTNFGVLTKASPKGDATNAELTTWFNDNIPNPSPQVNQYWQFYSFNEFYNQFIEAEKIPFYAYIGNTGKIVQLTKIKFSQHSTANFLSFENGGVAEMIQTCFDIKDEEYQRLNDHFASLGSVIIPSQTWSSQVFNNSTIPEGKPYPATQIGNVGGYNIDFISVWHHSINSSTLLNKEFLTNIQLILDGRPVNALPYDYVNDKCVVDMTQAILDTDNEEINHDYITSLTEFNENDKNTYTDAQFSAIYGDGKTTSTIRKSYISNPGTYALNFSTNLPDAFHSGACILENSNRQAVIRFNANSAEATNDELGKDRGKFPYIPTHMNQKSTVVGFSCFCDCCIVLTYDAARGTCYDGQLSWAAPYA